MTQLPKIILNPCRMNHAISSETKKADKANEATVDDICQGNHLQNLSPACHKSKAPVYEHCVDSFPAQSSTQQKLWIILTKRVLFPGILDIIDRFLFVVCWRLFKTKKQST